MIFFDYEKVRESLENFQRCKKEFEIYFLAITDSIDKIQKMQPDTESDVISELILQKGEIEAFLVYLQQMINVVEYAHNCYSKTAKKLVLDCEKLFIDSKVPEKMQLISLDAYRKEMKDISFGKRG